MIFHTDDLLMAHSQRKIVAEHIKLLEEVRGIQDFFTVVRGNIHEHLWMTIDFSQEVVAAFHQHDFEKKTWKDMIMELKEKHRRTQLREDLFKGDQNSESLYHKKKDQFHDVVANFLWIS